MISKILKKLSSPSPTLIDYINLKVQLPNEIKESITEVCQVEYLKKGTLLNKEGMVTHQLFFIEKGSARTSYYLEDKDVTSWIYREGQILTSWSSFFSRKPSYENIELTEDSKIVSLTYNELHELYQRYSKMQAFGRIMLEDQMVFLDCFYKGFAFMTAKERYDLLLFIFPDITQRVNLGHIASFLGITQATLSRIRKKK